MSCNQDEGCKNIYSVIYPSYKSSIDSSIDELSNSVLEVSNVLKELYIPDDYLGNKIQTKIDELYKKFNSSIEELSTEKANIDTFIDDKVIVHKYHYNTWKANLESQSDTNNESEGGSSE